MVPYRYEGFSRPLPEIRQSKVLEEVGCAKATEKKKQKKVAIKAVEIIFISGCTGVSFSKWAN
jgi:hypothetical protein